MGGATKLFSSIGGNMSHGRLNNIGWCIVLLSGNRRNASSVRLLLLLLLLCLFTELLDLRLFKRLQLVIVLGRVLPRVNRDSTWRLVIITCLALLLLGLLLILGDSNFGNLTDVGGLLRPGLCVLHNCLEVLLTQLKISKLLLITHASLDSSLDLWVTNTSKVIGHLLGLCNWFFQELQLIMCLLVPAYILVKG